MSSNPFAIRAENVGKQYRLGTGQTSLRSFLSSWSNSRKGKASTKLFWALKGISFEARKGEALGIIGRNGAGKTTILKLLSKVTRPTTGDITLNGSFSSLIELGAGFHPDLTGRDNIYLNGAILGLTQKQIKDRFDEIVNFSELGRFIDMPVKRYSSGMYARLGFAVAAHVDPDILLVDEVLAVGDEGFQRKCYDFIHAFVKSGKTTVFVSHNLYVIEQLCDRVIWLDNGEIVMIDEPGQVLSAYMDRMNQQQMVSDNILESETEDLTLVRVSCVDEAGHEKTTFDSGEDVIIQAQYTASRPIHNPYFHFSIADAQGGPPLFHASMLVDGNTPPTIQGVGVIRCRFKALPLMPKVYQIWGEVFGGDRARILVKWQRMSLFQINAQDQAIGRGGVRHLRADAPIKVSYQWEWND